MKNKGGGVKSEEGQFRFEISDLRLKTRAAGIRGEASPRREGPNAEDGIALCPRPGIVCYIPKKGPFLASSRPKGAIA